MKKISKKIVSIITAIFVLLTVFAVPIPVSAESNTIVKWTEGVTGGAIYFDTATGAITDCDSTVTEVTVPERINNVKVKSINREAFYYCTLLEEITLPNTVVSIGDNAFYTCTALKGIELPNSVTSIGTGTFRYCNSLENVIFPNNITQIPAGMFNGCRALTNITIPNSVTTIGYMAFADCRGIENITIPNSVVNIGNLAFNCCTSIKQITIPNKLKNIGEDVFSHCYSLEKVDIPNSVTSIDFRAFGHCESLENIIIPDSVKTIKGVAFGWCTSLKNIMIPNSVTSIDDSAFLDCNFDLLTIKGEANSYAETFAKKNGIKFKDGRDSIIKEGANITEEDLYGEYAYYLYENDAYKTMLSNLYKVLEKAVYKTSNDSSASCKAAMEVVGGLDLIEYLGFFLGVDSKKEKIAEELALELIRDIDGKNDLLEYAVEYTADEIESNYEDATVINSIISKGIKTVNEFTLVAKIFEKSNLINPKLAMRFFKEMKDVWDEVGDAFEAAGIVINFTQLSLEILFTMEAENYVVTKVRDNVPEYSALYKGLDAVDKKQQKSIESNLIKVYLKEGVIKTLANFFAEESLNFASGAFRVAALPFTLAALFIPVSADDKVKALTADGNCAILSQAVKTKAAEIKSNYDKGNFDKIEGLKEDYRLLFEAYMHSIKNYKEYAYDVADKKTKREIEICYRGIEHWLSYEQYIQSCLHNANASWDYEVKNGNAIIKGYQNNAPTQSGSRILPNKFGENESKVLLGIPENIDEYEVVRIDNAAVKGDTSIEHVFVPETVKSIGASAFEGCTSIKSINIGNQIETIEDDAFSGCLGLSSIDLPYSLETISDSAFSDIDSITINAVEGTVGETFANSNSNCEYNEKELKVTNIEISQMPTKLVYKMSEELDTDGIQVIATYEDGSTKDVTSLVYCEFDEKVLGTSKINVIYGDQKVDYTVEVTADVCEYSVSYQNEFGEAIADSVTGTAMAGEEFNLPVKEIEGYIPDDPAPTAMIGEFNEFIVTYTSVPDVQIEDTAISEIEEQYYTGKQIKPTVTVEYEGEVLVEGTDYYLDYDENINVGTGTVVIIGTGDYEGLVERTFNIVGNMKDANVKLAYSNYSYTGSQRKPEPTVTFDGTKLIKGREYTVSYGTNKYPGYGTVKITGIGNYKGTVEKKFTIAKVNGLKVKSTGTNAIKLSWTKQPNVKGYKIYRLKDGKYKLIKTVTGASNTSYTVKNLSSGTGYKFKVRTYVGTKPYYGEYSSILSAPTKPGKVTMSKLTTGRTQYVKAYWKKKTGTGYQMMLATNSKFTKNKKTYTIKSYKTTSKKIAKLKKGQTYYVKVRAYKTYGGKAQYGQWSKYKSIKCK